MNAADYQEQASRTMIQDGTVPDFPPAGLALGLELLRLGATVGEAADSVKKGVYHEHGIQHAELDRLLGQVRTLARDATRMQHWPYPDWPPAQTPQQVRLGWNALGIVGEGGEVARLVAYHLETGEALDLDAVIKELGDNLWYIVAICTLLGLDLGAVMEANIAKLKARYPEGWDPQRSQDRTAEAAHG